MSFVHVGRDIVDFPDVFCQDCQRESFRPSTPTQLSCAAARHLQIEAKRLKVLFLFSFSSKKKIQLLAILPLFGDDALPHTRAVSAYWVGTTHAGNPGKKHRENLQYRARTWTKVIV